MGRWLILADDLTGAADCAIAFVRCGLETLVIWLDRAGHSEVDVLAVDAGSRRLDAPRAALRHRALLTSHLVAGRHLYKKIDSTLRGLFAAEMAATNEFLRERRGRPVMALVAPAFPATGRTTVGGRVLVGGRPLEETRMWEHDHSYSSANLSEVLATAGLQIVVAPLDLVRRGAAALQTFLDNAVAEAVVCDAESTEDLAVIAAASLPLKDRIYWVGSAGLAGALARIAGGGHAHSCVTLPRRTGGNLVVAGSLAEASRQQAATLAQSGLVRRIAIEPEAFVSTQHREQAAALEDELRAGRDVLVEVGTAASPNLAGGAEVASRLAEFLAPAAGLLGGLILTGGEIARAVLSRLGVDGIHPMDEVGPGVPLGVTSGALEIPVITKAGAFGGPETLVRCLERLKRE